ncbi:MAG: hypothetical protein OXN94_06925 [Chloroflexota bacterium]|nr:hypothetical protein [Chloroflexota bacterium]
MTIEDSPKSEMTDENSESSQNVILPAEILERIPEDEREAFSQQLINFGIQITREERYSSSLLPYKEAAGWNELVPGSAERIFSRYEQLEFKKIEATDRVLTIAEEKFQKDSDLEKQRHDDSVSIAKSVIKFNSAKVRQGQWIGFVGALLLFAGGIYLVNLGESLLGVAVFLFEVVAFAGVYVNETRRSQSGSVSAAGRRIEPPSDRAPN